MDKTTRGVVFGLILTIAGCGALLCLLEDAGIKSLTFIERFFVFSPGGGDGSIKILLLVVMVILVSAIGLSLRAPVR